MAKSKTSRGRGEGAPKKPYLELDADDALPSQVRQVANGVNDVYDVAAGSAEDFKDLNGRVEGLEGWRKDAEGATDKKLKDYSKTADVNAALGDERKARETAEAGLRDERESHAQTRRYVNQLGGLVYALADALEGLYGATKKVAGRVSEKSGQLFEGDGGLTVEKLVEQARAARVKANVLEVAPTTSASEQPKAAEPVPKPAEAEPAGRPKNGKGKK